MDFTEQYELFQEYQNIEKKLVEPSISANDINAYNLQKKEIELRLQAIHSAFDLIRRAEIEGVECTLYHDKKYGCLGKYYIYFSWEQFGERRYLEFFPENSYLVEDEFKDAEKFLEGVKQLKSEYKVARDKALEKLTDDEKRLLGLNIL